MAKVTKARRQVSHPPPKKSKVEDSEDSASDDGLGEDIAASPSKKSTNKFKNNATTNTTISKGKMKASNKQPTFSAIASADDFASDEDADDNGEHDGEGEDMDEHADSDEQDENEEDEDEDASEDESDEEEPSSRKNNASVSAGASSSKRRKIVQQDDASDDDDNEHDGGGDDDQGEEGGDMDEDGDDFEDGLGPTLDEEDRDGFGDGDSDEDSDGGDEDLDEDGFPKEVKEQPQKKAATKKRPREEKPEDPAEALYDRKLMELKKNLPGQSPGGIAYVHTLNIKQLAQLEKAKDAGKVIVVYHKAEVTPNIILNAVKKAGGRTPIAVYRQDFDRALVLRREGGTQPFVTSLVICNTPDQARAAIEKNICANTGGYLQRVRPFMQQGTCIYVTGVPKKDDQHLVRNFLADKGFHPHWIAYVAQKKATGLHFASRREAVTLRRLCDKQLLIFNGQPIQAYFRTTPKSALRRAGRVKTTKEINKLATLGELVHKYKL